MNNTNLLPPISAVYLVWGTTRKFAESSNSDSFEAVIKPYFEDLIREAGTNDLEKSYLSQAYPLLMASMRNVIIIYKGRQLNYSENKSIRETYLESVKNELNITNQVKEVLKSLPAITIGGVSGIVIAESSLKTDENVKQLLFALIFAALGYLARFFYARYTTKLKQLNFIRQDYEITNYYVHYLFRMEEVMLNLYHRLESLHEKIFDQKYDGSEKSAEAVKEMFLEIHPRYCPLLSKHIYTKKVNQNRWQMCEVGLPLSAKCKYYKEEE
jgi:hypothetical protein